MREEGIAPHVLSRGAADAAMYWSAAQIVAHHSSNGCNLQPGDLIGTGTLSTDSAGGLGSLLEISQGGKQPVQLANGDVLAFGGTLDYFVDTVFNYPTLAECYKTAAFDGINRLGG